MYVVDITRDGFETDILCGNDSMDSKNKTINYIMDYAFANYNIYLDKDILDRNLNMDLFSLKAFLNDHYSLIIDNDLIIQSLYTDKEHCLFVKHYDKHIDSSPIFYALDKNKEKLACSIKNYLTNDSLIQMYENDLSTYERLRVDLKDKYNFQHKGIHGEIISLYNGGMFLEELLNNSLSLQQLRERKVEVIDL